MKNIILAFEWIWKSIRKAHHLPIQICLKLSKSIGPIYLSIRIGSNLYLSDFFNRVSKFCDEHKEVRIITIFTLVARLSNRPNRAARSSRRTSAYNIVPWSHHCTQLPVAWRASQPLDPFWPPEMVDPDLVHL